MNIVKRFLSKSKVYNMENSVMIPSGQLYLVRSPSSPKSENECLYNDAILTIRETNHQFSYELVVWKSYESDSDSLNNDENEEVDDEEQFFERESNILKTFLIDSSLKLCLFERYEERIISWRDMEGDIGDMFEYRITMSVPNDTIEEFMTSIYKCKYERKYRRSSKNIDVKDLKEFILDRNKISDSCLNSANTPSASSTMNMSDLLASSDWKIKEEVEYANREVEYESDSEVDNQENLVYESGGDSVSCSEGEDEDEEFVDATEAQISELSEDDLKQRILLESFECKVYIYDAKFQVFKIKSSEGVASLFQLNKWNYCLELRDNKNNEVHALTMISNQMDPAFKFEQLSFLFNTFFKFGAYTWLLKFEDRGIFDEFQILFMKLHWQYKNERLWQNINDVDEQYLSDMMDVLDVDDPEEANTKEDFSEDELEDEVVESSAYQGLSQNRRKLNIDESDDEEYERKYDFIRGSHNKGLVMGLKTDRAFISRGDKIGIFRTDTDNGIEFQAAIENLSYSKNGKKLITPDRMLLLDNDRSMIIQDKRCTNNLHKIDLEYGKVIEDWSMKRDGEFVNVESFTTNTKYGDLMNDPTFMGISSQSMFSIDPRLKDGFVSDNGKLYKTKVNFKQVATTSKGYIAVASKNGEIRLYDKLGGNAKTVLPALGDEIIGLSTSNDGRYLLATCENYLLLIDLLIQNGKFANKLGFERSFSVAEKPMPKKLQLKPEHMAYIKGKYGLNVKFSVAKFNETSHGDLPTHIISSIGPFAVTWKFDKLLQNQKNCYKIKQYSDNVIMSDFSNSNNKKMVLTLPDDITMTSTTAFRNPNDEFNIVKTAF